MSIRSSGYSHQCKPLFIYALVGALKRDSRHIKTLQRGIDKLVHNKFYREMYEKFKSN